MIKTHSTRWELFGAAAAGMIVVLFSLVLLWFNPLFFWADDYELAFLPVFADVAQSWSEGNWPLLSPYSWLCGNLAGEFQYGTFSFFINAAVVLIWKVPLAFPQQAAALSMVHLAALAAGAYLLARGRNLPSPSALMVALVASLNGWMMCWGATDWFGALAAFTWLPWSWWALEYATRRDGPRWRTLLPAPFIYLLITAGFPYTVLMLGVVTGWLALKTLSTYRSWRAPLQLVPGWLFGMGLSAPAWLALLDYAHGSRRASEVFLPRQWLVPLNALPGLILPSWTVQWWKFEERLMQHVSLELACGLVPVVLVLGAAMVLRGKFVSALRWELVLLGIALCLCMLPSPGIFRFSFRWLVLFHLVLALTAAEAYRLWRSRSVMGSPWMVGNPGFWAAALVGGATIAAPIYNAAPPASALHMPIILLQVAALWWAFYRLLHRQANSAAWLLPIFTTAALLAACVDQPNHADVASFAFEDDLNQVEPLDPSRLYLSLYNVPPGSYRSDQVGPYGAVTRPGNTSMIAGVHLVNGYSPVGPAGIARLLGASTQGAPNPAQIADFVLPESGPDGLLAQLGIDGIIVARDLPLPSPLPPNWERVISAAPDSDDLDSDDAPGEADVYHRRGAPLPTVRSLAHKAVGAPDAYAIAAITEIADTRNEVTATVNVPKGGKPALIAFSRPFFRGYHANLAGKSVAVGSYEGLMPTIELPAGSSGRLRMVYRPWWLTVGSAGAVACLAIWVVGFFFARRRM